MLVLSRSDLESIVDVDATLAALRDVLAQQGGPCDTVAPHPLRLGGDDAVHIPMLGVDARQGLVTSKLLTDRPSNVALGRPSQVSAIAVYDRETGALRAVLHGAVPTRVRTAATTAVATDLLANPDADDLGLIGAGALAVEHAVTIDRVRPLRTIRVWSRRASSVESFTARLRQRWPGAGASGPCPQIIAMPDAEAVVRASSVVCTLTPSVEPVVRGEWLSAGQHVNAVGARPRPDERELDTAAMHAGRVFVDHEDVVRHESGDHRLAVHPEGGQLPTIVGDLAGLLRGEVPGRLGADDLTIYNSVGNGLQDTAIVGALLAEAQRRGIGTQVAFDG